MAIWPPNLSQLLPDLFVAGVTGLIVGFVILTVEDRRDQRREDAEATLQRANVITAVAPSLEEPIWVGQRVNELIPERDSLRVLTRRVNDVPPLPAPRERMPSFVFLRAIAEHFEAVQLAAGRVERRLSRHALPSYWRSAVLAHIQSFRENPDAPWSTDALDIHENHKRRLNDDEELVNAVRDYARLGRFLELAREAFVEVNGAWSADSWEIALRQHKGAPRTPWVRWWRNRRAARERSMTIEKAMASGREIMARGGTWFEPRGS